MQIQKKEKELKKPLQMLVWCGEKENHHMTDAIEANETIRELIVHTILITNNYNLMCNRFRH